MVSLAVTLLWHCLKAAIENMWMREAAIENMWMSEHGCVPVKVIYGHWN